MHIRFAFLLMLSIVALAEDYITSPATLKFVTGKTYTVAVQFTGCTNGGNATHRLADKTTTKFSATGSGITVNAPADSQVHDCDWTGSITVAQDAETGDFALVIQEKSLTTSIPIKIIAKAAGPIPPGLEPTVDLAWSVLPRRISSDNFGARITKLYYPIQVVIGNNSGYDLQLTAVQFKLPGDPFQTDVPTDSYYLVRSSLQREQLIGARNTTVNIIKAIGPILTGAAVFYTGTSLKGLHHKTHFQGITDIFSNPFEKGVELVFPDLTVQQLINLDNHTLRDGMIIANNTQVRTIVFVNKDLLIQAARGKEPHVQRRALKTGTEVKSEEVKAEIAIKELGGQSKLGHHEYNPQEVMRELGSLELVGRSIVYLNRVSVISNAPGPGPQFTLSPSSVKQDDQNIDLTKIALTLTGDGLSGGKLSASDPSSLILSNPTVGDGGKSFTASLDASKASAKVYTLTLTTASASQSAQFEVKAGNISIPNPPTITLTAGAAPTAVTINGMWLDNVVSVVADKACADSSVQYDPQDPKNTRTSITATFSGKSKASNCKATVSGKSGNPILLPYSVQ